MPTLIDYLEDFMSLSRGEVNIDILFSYMLNYVSQLTVETYCFADGLCLFKQPQSVISCDEALAVTHVVVVLLVVTLK